MVLFIYFVFCYQFRTILIASWLESAGTFASSSNLNFSHSMQGLEINGRLWTGHFLFGGGEANRQRSCSYAIGKIFMIFNFYDLKFFYDEKSQIIVYVKQYTLCHWRGGGIRLTPWPNSSNLFGRVWYGRANSQFLMPLRTEKGFKDTPSLR